MSNGKSEIEVTVTDVDAVWIEPRAQGGLRLVLCTEGGRELALRIPPKVLAKLEGMLAAAHEAEAGMAERH